MSTSENEIPGLFLSFQQNFNDEQTLRDEIREIMKSIEEVGRKVTTQMQSIHLESFQNQIPDICSKGRILLKEVIPLYSRLSIIIPQGEFYKYHDHWRNSTQRIVFIAALITFLENGELLTREAAASTLGLKVYREQGFHLDLEDYLSGILLLASELSRFAVNSVTAGDYGRPLQISRFVNELNSGFRLLNFKNDGLRKRFDGLKYDLKKIEEVVYDLSIRGLTPIPLGLPSNVSVPEKEKKQESKVRESVISGHSEVSERLRKRSSSKSPERKSKDSQVSQN